MGAIAIAKATRPRLVLHITLNSSIIVASSHCGQREYHVDHALLRGSLLELWALQEGHVGLLRSVEAVTDVGAACVCEGARNVCDERYSALPGL